MESPQFYHLPMNNSLYPNHIRTLNNCNFWTPNSKHPCLLCFRLSTSYETSTDTGSRISPNPRYASFPLNKPIQQNPLGQTAQRFHSTLTYPLLRQRARPTQLCIQTQQEVDPEVRATSFNFSNEFGRYHLRGEC